MSSCSGLFCLFVYYLFPSFTIFFSSCSFVLLPRVPETLLFVCSLDQQPKNRNTCEHRKQVFKSVEKLKRTPRGGVQMAETVGTKIDILTIAL